MLYKLEKVTEGEGKGGVRGEGVLLCLCALAGLTVIHLKSRR